MAKLSIKLPTNKTRVKTKAEDFAYLIHGDKSVGKTSLVTELLPDVLFLQFDRTQKALSTYEIIIQDWVYLRAVLDELEKADEFPYSGVCVDGADLFYFDCYNYVLTKTGKTHPGDEAFGKIWNQIKNEFKSATRRILNLPGGTFFLAHSKWKDRKKRDGSTWERLVPTLSGQAEECLNGFADATFAFTYDGDDRVLYMEGSESVSAGHSLTKHFNYTDGTSIAKLNVGTSPTEAAKIFHDAFDNKIVKPERKTKRRRK